MEKTEFTGILRASASEGHPLQSVIEFVFTDFKPNKNKQGVQASEADNIIETGVNQPVKVNFLGESVAAHKNAIPVGPIVSMTKTDDRIIGKAVLWKDEYPDFINYLEKSSASESGVQFSWELYYSKSENINDTQWLQGVVVGGITVVSDPAYSGRTPLLSFAEDRSSGIVLQDKIAEFTGGLMADPTLESLTEQVQSVSDKLYAMVSMLYEALDEARPDPTVTDLDSVLTEFASLLDRLRATKTESASALAELVTVKSELDELRDYKTQKEAAEARTALVVTRSEALSSVMSKDDIAEKLDFVLGLSDSQFDTFVASLQTVRQKSTSSTQHTAGGADIPDFTSPQLGGAGQVTIADVAREFLKQRATI